MSDNHFHIAHLSEKDKSNLCELEHKFNAETGKDYVLIAWEKK